MKLDITEILLRQHRQPIHINMPIPRLIETAVCNGEGLLTDSGALRVTT